MKRQRNKLQTKELDKTLEKELNEMEITNLPDKVQSNGHTDVHRTGEKSR